MRAKPKKSLGQPASLDRQRRRLGAETSPCPLCGRVMVMGESLNEHHLIPRAHGGTEKFFLHRICHSKIHSVLSERELAESFATFEKLQQHPEIASFILWVRKQPPQCNAKHLRGRKK